MWGYKFHLRDTELAAPRLMLHKTCALVHVITNMRL